MTHEPHCPVPRAEANGEGATCLCNEDGRQLFELQKKMLQDAGKKDMLTLTDWQLAYDSQSACNLSGIVFAFAKVMRKICDEATRLGEGTEWRNRHPIAVLYATQIAHLTGICYLAETDVYSKAYDAVTQKIEELKLSEQKTAEKISEILDKVM